MNVDLSDVKELYKEFSKILDDLTEISNEIKDDCNKYIKMETGAMRDSSEYSSDLKNGKIIWETPYVVRQYFTGTPSKEVNPNASLQWCEKAETLHGAQWVEKYGDYIGGKVGAK